MDPVLLDTGYLIALEAADDQNHPSAAAHWEMLQKSISSLVTTSFIFDEVVTFFNSRNRHEKAVEIGRMLLESPRIKFINVTEDVFHRGWQYFQQRPDKSYSLTDCISFIVMHDNAIGVALTFDGHFVQAGFQKLP